MKNDNNDFKLMSGTTLSLAPYPAQYKVNADNIKTIDDVKLILKYLNLHFSPPTKEDYEEIKHLLILN